MSENIHEGHRSRLIKRYEREGLAFFEDHNVLELLLFFAIPRVDTNPIAHRLLNSFGSLHAVFDAGFEELCQVKGVGPKTASFIKLCPQIAKRVEASRLEAAPLDTEGLLGAYLVNHFRFTPPETACVLLLDQKMNLISNEPLSYGEISLPECVLEKTLEVTEGKNASFAVLSHNHGDVGTKPTNADRAATEAIRVALEERGVELIAHYIVSGYDFKNFMGMEKGDQTYDI